MAVAALHTEIDRLEALVERAECRRKAASDDPWLASGTLPSPPARSAPAPALTTLPCAAGRCVALVAPLPPQQPPPGAHAAAAA